MAATLEPTSEQMLEMLSRMAAGSAAPGAAAADGGIMVVPAPGFIVKTTVLGRPAGTRALAPIPDEAVAIGRKVFINVCCNEGVAPFSRVKHLGDDGAEEEGINVPVAVGPHREELDNGGRPCSVYDVIVHPGVVADCARDGTGAFRACIVQLAVGYVEKKFALSLSPRYRLPTGGYRGEPQPQRIRSRPSRAGISEAAASGSGGGGVPSPLQLLAEAGAVPQQAVFAGAGSEARQRAAAAELIAAAAARSGGPPSATTAGAAAPQRPPPRGGDLRSSNGGAGVSMDLRVLPSPDAETAAGLVAAGLREAREDPAGGSGGADAALRMLGGAPEAGVGAAAPPLLTPAAASSAPVRRPGGGDDAAALRALLRDAALRADPAALAPAVSADVSANALDVNDADGGGSSVAAPTRVPCQRRDKLPQRGEEAKAKAKGAAAAAGISFSVSCPPTAAEAGAASSGRHRQLRVVLRYPASLAVAVPAATHAYVARLAAAAAGGAAPSKPISAIGGEDVSSPPPSTLPVDVTVPAPSAAPVVRLRAGGSVASVELPGSAYPPVSLHLLLGDSAAAAAASLLAPDGSSSGSHASWHAASRTLVISLRLQAPRPDAALPSLASLREALTEAAAHASPPAAAASAPSSGSEAPSSSSSSGASSAAAAAAALLSAWVESPAARAAAPDAGTKQWLLAHALAEEGDGGDRPATAPPAPAAVPAPPAPVSDADVLPEDAFIAADALSMHFVRQRAEDRAEREAKAKAQADAEAGAAAARAAAAQAEALAGVPVEGRAAVAAVASVAAALGGEGEASLSRALALL